MPWTATITQISRDQNNPLTLVQVSILFDDGTDRRHTINDRFSNTNPEALKNYCRQRIAQLEAIDAFVADPPLGALDLSFPEPQAPTDEQLVDQDYQRQRQILIQAKQDLDIGLIVQEDFDAQLATVQTAKASLIAIKSAAQVIK